MSRCRDWLAARATDAPSNFSHLVRLLDAVADLGLPHEGNAAGVVTISAGTASQAPAPPAAGSPAELIARADEALYAAKEAGRNQALG